MRRLPMLAAVLLPLPVCAAADSSREAASVISELAATLAAGNASEFLRNFDPAMPDYEKLRDNVTALTRQAETQSYIEVVSNEGDDQARTLVLTWELRVQHTGDATATARPEARVTCKLRKEGKRWRIVSFTPLDFLGV